MQTKPQWRWPACVLVRQYVIEVANKLGFIPRFDQEPIIGDTMLAVVGNNSYRFICGGFAPFEKSVEAMDSFIGPFPAALCVVLYSLPNAFELSLHEKLDRITQQNEMILTLLRQPKPGMGLV